MAEQATEKDYMQCPGAYTFQRTDSKKEFQINPQQGQQSWNNKEHPWSWVWLMQTYKYKPQVMTQCQLLNAHYVRKKTSAELMHYFGQEYYLKAIWEPVVVHKCGHICLKIRTTPVHDGYKENADEINDVFPNAKTKILIREIQYSTKQSKGLLHCTGNFKHYCNKENQTIWPCIQR